jgi:hypothetical protein
MVGPSHRDGAAAHIPVAGAMPVLAGAQIAAWWKLATLPLDEMPWLRPEEAGLP